MPIIDDILVDAVAVSKGDLRAYLAAQEVVSVKDPSFGAVGDGIANDQDAFDAARTASGGRYHIPPGTYVLDAIADPTVSPNVWLDNFTADAGVTLKIGGVDYDVSNAVHGAWRFVVDSERYLSMVHARTGETIVRWSNGENSSDSHRFWLPIDIRRDSHAMIMAPGTTDGDTDLLWRKSEAPSSGAAQDNRFSITYEEDLDRWGIYYATTATGAPSFDAMMRGVAGTSPTCEFPAIRVRFLQGLSVKQRSSGGFQSDIVPTSTATEVRRNSDAAVLARFTEDGMQVGNQLYMGLSTARGIFMGAGSPEGVITASQGSLYLRTNGSTGSNMYFKTSGTGNTGWTAVTGV